MSVETFEDAFGEEFLKEEGTFKFTIKDAKLTESRNGDPMIEVLLQCDKGQTKDYFVLSDKAKWKYKKFIALAFGYTSKEALIAADFQKDLETVHNELIGKTVFGKVEQETYEKEIKVPKDDDTFETKIEERVSYKIVDYIPM